MTTIPWQLDPLQDVGLRGNDRSASIVAEVVGSLLLTEGRADATALAPGDDPRGWWHDGLGQPIGSTIWTFQGEPLVDETLRAVEQAAIRALQVAVEDGIITAVTATAAESNGRLDLSVSVTKPDGTNETLRWPDVWAAV